MHYARNAIVLRIKYIIFVRELCNYYFMKRCIVDTKDTV